MKAYGNVHNGLGKISAFGIDVVEESASPDIKVTFVQNQSVNISGSTNVVVGDHNKQTMVQALRDISAAIDASSGSPEQKAEARSLLRQALEHPLLAAIVGGALSAI